MIAAEELRKKMEYALNAEETYSVKVMDFYEKFVETLIPDNEVRQKVAPLIEKLNRETKKHINIVKRILIGSK